MKIPFQSHYARPGLAGELGKERRTEPGLRGAEGARKTAGLGPAVFYPVQSS